MPFTGVRKTKKLQLPAEAVTTILRESGMKVLDLLQDRHAPTTMPATSSPWRAMLKTRIAFSPSLA